MQDEPHPATTTPGSEPPVADAFGTRSPSLLAGTAWRLINHRQLSQAARARLRKKVGPLFPGPYDLAVQGTRFRLYPMENYCDRVALSRHELPEREERAMLEPWIPAGGVFVDVGANVGTYALPVSARVGGSGRVIAFEPHPRTFAKLAFNIAANGAANVTALNCGCGPQARSMTLWSDGGNNMGSASVLRQAAGNARIATPVKIERLPDVLERLGIGAVDALKIDIEGFEDEALLPLFDERHRRLWPAAILLETAHRDIWKTDLVAALTRLGYRGHAATRENVLLANLGPRR